MPKFASRGNGESSRRGTGAGPLTATDGQWAAYTRGSRAESGHHANGISRLVNGSVFVELPANFGADVRMDDGQRRAEQRLPDDGPGADRSP